MAEATVPEFRRALLARFRKAEKSGERHLEVACRDLHDKVNSGGNKPAVCSGVMWSRPRKETVRLCPRRLAEPDVA